MLGIHGEDEPEVRVRVHNLEVSVHDALLAQHQAAPGLQQPVEAVQHGGVAEVDVVDEQPVAALQRVDEDSAAPAERPRNALQVK